MNNQVALHLERLFSEEPDSNEAPLLSSIYRRYLRVARGGGDGFLDGLTRKLLRGSTLCGEEARRAMEILMLGEGEERESVALFLCCSPPERLSSEELAAYAAVMREKAEPIRPRCDGRLADTCGTGGDVLKTFNVSTAAALVLAASGVRVAKHGNRGITSACGSADVLEKLGVAVDLDPAEVQTCIEEVGIGFLFAPRFHRAMKNVQAVRRTLAAESARRGVVRTMFNVLGPLTNPAGASHQLIGVYDPALVRTFAEVLRRLGVAKALVVHGTGPNGKGMDEISTMGPTRVAELAGGEIREYEVTPADLGLPTAAGAEDFLGGDPDRSARILSSVLAGTDDGPRRDFAAANSGAALFAAGEVASLADGVGAARVVLASGRARAKLEELARRTSAAARARGA